tara:strand:+ start:15537 stop:16871 length:1335 start_codon:yes stop_codon:yes gene_type:complete
MAHSVTKSGPYFEGSGQINFSDLRSTFRGASSASISASDLLRKTENTIESPVVPDCTENAAVAESENWKVSQMRGTIKDYKITQTSSNSQLDGTSIEWNGNLTKNIRKVYNIQGTISSTSINNKALTFELDNIINLNINISSTANIFGAGGLGGPYVQSGSTFLNGSDGGDAIQFNSSGGKNNKIILSNTNSLTVAGGGGGGGNGGNGADGATGPCWKPRINAVSGSYTGNKGPQGQIVDDYSPGPWGEWYTYKIGGSCQCEYYSACPDPSTDGTRNAPITIRGTTYNTRGRNSSGGSSTTGTVGSGTFSSNRAGGGCNCWGWGFVCHNTCIDGAYCAVEDPIETRGGKGGSGGAGANGQGFNQSKQNGSNGTAGEAKNCPTIGSAGGDGGKGGNGGSFGEPGQNGGGINFYSGGNAGRAIRGTGYTVEGVNADNLKGGYLPDV